MINRRNEKRYHNGDLVAAIDVGASKAACLIAYLAPMADGIVAPEVLGAGLQGVTFKEQRGGRALAAERALRAAVEAAERMAGERIQSAWCAVSGRLTHCRRLGVELDVDGRQITPEDISDCIRQGSGAAAPEGYSAIDAQPITFHVDSENVGGDPSGLAGSRLTLELLGVSVRDAHFANAEMFAERSGLRVAGMAAAPAAAGEAVLYDDEKELGAIVIDLGARSTNYATYAGGALIDCGGITLGGEHVTRDIAQVFGAPLSHSERVKTLHGSAIAGVGDEHKLVDLEQLGEAGTSSRVCRSELTTVVASRFEEILELLWRQATDDGRRLSDVRRAILTGGASQLIGARETAERVLGVKSRLGRPTLLLGAPEVATSPQYSVCVGLLQLAAKRREHGAHLGAASFSVGARGVLSGVSRWIRTNF